MEKFYYEDEEQCIFNEEEENYDYDTAFQIEKEILLNNQVKI